MKKIFIFISIFFVCQINFGQIGIVASSNYNQKLELESKSLLSRATNPPSPEAVVLINNVIKSLKTAGYWTGIDCLQKYNTETSDFAVLNWKENKWNATFVGDPVFTPKYFITTANNKYVNTGFVPSEGVNFQTNNATWFNGRISSPSASVTDGVLTTDGGTTAIHMQHGYYYRLNGIDGNATERVLQDGYNIITRSSSSATRIYNGAWNTNSKNSVGRPTQSSLVGAYHNDAVVVTGSGASVNVGQLFGKYFSDAACDSIRTILETFDTNIKLIDFSSSNTMTFSSIQPASITQVSLTYRLTIGKIAYINWGNGTKTRLTATNTDQTITSNYVTNNSTYTITLLGNIESITKIHIDNNSTVVINSSEIKKLTGLTHLYLFLEVGGSGVTINSTDLKLLPLTYFLVKGINSSSVFNSSDFVGMSLTNFNVIVYGSTNTINSHDFVGMPLTEYVVSSNSGTVTTNSTDFVGMALTVFEVTHYGLTSHINSSDFVGMALTDFKVFGGISNTVINTSNFVGMPLTILEIGHTGSLTVVNTANLSGISTLTDFQLYADGGTYTLNMTDFSGLSNLTTLYLNKSSSSMAIASGKLADLPAGLLNLTMIGVTNLDITTGTMKDWANTTMILTNGHTTAQVDGFLNAWAATATGTTAKTITLSGTGAGIANQARSAASDDAVTHLQTTHSKTIVTTP